MRASTRFGRALLPFALLALSAALAACTSDNPEITGNPNAAPIITPAPKGACALISTADAAALLGEPTAQAYDNPGRAGTYRCIFANSPTTNLTGVNKVVVGIDESDSAKANFQTGKAAAGATPVAELADDAFVTVGVTGDTQITVLKGEKFFYIHLGVPEVTYTADQQASNFEALKALILRVLPSF